MSVTDLAFTILKNYGKPMHFKDLINEVMRVKAINQENPGRLIAQMHTEINLDSRFVHLGNGEWGLREWQPKTSKVVKIRPEPQTTTKSSRSLLSSEADDEDFPYDEEEDEEEELIDEIDDEFALEDEEFEDEEPLDDDLVEEEDEEDEEEEER